MNITIVNECFYTVKVKINEKTRIKLKSESIAEITYEGDSIELSVRRKKNDKTKDIYVIELQSNYKFSDLGENITFKITAHRDKIAECVFYDRTEISCDNAKCEEKSYEIINKWKVKKAFNKHEYGNVLKKADQYKGFIDLIIGLFIWISYGIEAAIIASLVVYLVLILYSCLESGFITLMRKVSLKQESDRKILNGYLKKEYLDKFYKISIKDLGLEQ